MDLNNLSMTTQAVGGNVVMCMPQSMGSQSDITEQLNDSNVRWQLAVWPWFPQFFQIILNI